MTIFEKIAKAEIPSYKVWENQEFMAFLDIRPVVPGHTLVIPKKAVDPLWKMDDSSFQRFMLAAKEVASVIQKKLACERVCMAVVGFEVPHAHIHLVPAASIQDFPWPGGKQATPEELSAMQKRIAS